MTPVAETYEDLRPLLFSIAYRMLGSVAEAEDIVQEAFLRYQRALSEHRGEIESPKAYLSAVTSRLAIDQLRSARTRREQYVGQWLPEPLLTDENPLEGARYVEEADSLSMAFLLVLERLSPVERAVFLLHDVFDYSYDEIATIADKSQDNCRQLAVRARRHVEQEKPRFEASRHQRDELARRFFTAVAGDGCFDDLVKLLAADVVAYSDGGGKGPAALRPLYGRDRVVGLLDRLATSARSLGVRGQHTEINGQPGAMFFDRSDRLINVMTIDIADGMIESVRSVTNPEKLRHLESPLTDIQGLLHELTEPQGMTAASSPPSERREATQ